MKVHAIPASNPEEETLASRGSIHVKVMALYIYTLITHHEPGTLLSIFIVNPSLTLQNLTGNPPENCPGQDHRPVCYFPKNVLYLTGISHAIQENDVSAFLLHPVDLT